MRIPRHRRQTATQQRLNARRAERRHIGERVGVDSSSKRYWWIVGRDRDTGKKWLIFGSDRSEEDARQHALEVMGNMDWDIKMLRTRNTAHASQMLKGHILDETQDIRNATRRLGHKL